MDWKEKLTSRKFWAAIVEFVTMLVIALGGTQDTATRIAALIMAGAGVIAWIVAEGMADAAGASGSVIMGEHVSTAFDKPREDEPDGK